MQTINRLTFCSTSSAAAWLALPAIGLTLIVALTARGAPSSQTQAGFRFAAVDERSLGLWENDQPVLVYNHGTMLRPGVPADRARSSYLHPIHGLDGEVLTDDFPKDHYHHRGLFWAWPHVRIGDGEYSLWDLRGIRHQFVKWTDRSGGPESAVLALENGWFVGDKQVMKEQLRLHVLPATNTGRIIDLALSWTPLDQPVALLGAANKSYGGLTLRYAPRTGTVITTPLGNNNKDLAVTRLKWADLSARFEGAPQPSGAAIFIEPTHPDYPPTWLTRHYGVLCVGWPGVKAVTLPPGRPVHCRYRIWIHRGLPDQQALEKQYADYLTALKEAGR